MLHITDMPGTSQTPSDNFKTFNHTMSTIKLPTITCNNISAHSANTQDTSLDLKLSLTEGTPTIFEDLMSSVYEGSSLL
jgi:hypothetical protein